MSKGWTVERSTFIESSPSQVWEALISPGLIKQYLFGTNVTSDWKVGSEILYEGEYQGKPYQDTGKILTLEPEHIFSSLIRSGGSSDPKDQHTVTYTLDAKDNGTRVTLSQDNCKDEAQAEHFGKNWETVLQSLKQLLESHN